MKVIETLSYALIKKGVRFEYVFIVSFPLYEFTLVIKLRIPILKVVEIYKYILIKKYMLSDLNMSHGKMSDNVSFPLFRFTLVIKLRDFDFKDH